MWKTLKTSSTKVITFDDLKATLVSESTNWISHSCLIFNFMNTLRFEGDNTETYRTTVLDRITLPSLRSPPCHPPKQKEEGGRRMAGEYLGPHSRLN